MFIFKKEKMLERTKEQLATYSEKDRKECLEIMDMLDGKEAVKSDWLAMTQGILEYYVRHDGVNYPVDINDCDYILK